MRAENLRLSPRLRAWVHGTTCALFLTGIAWWALHRWGAIETGFGETTNPAAPWVLRVHGAVAMLMLVVLGILGPLHVRRGWHANRNRRSGAGLVATMTVLTITGWLLYYAGGERLRSTASALHLWLGFLLPLIVVIHIWLGRRARVHPRREAAHSRASSLPAEGKATPEADSN